MTPEEQKMYWLEDTNKYVRGLYTEAQNIRYYLGWIAVWTFGTMVGVWMIWA